MSRCFEVVKAGLLALVSDEDRADASAMLEALIGDASGVGDRGSGVGESSVEYEARAAEADYLAVCSELAMVRRELDGCAEFREQVVHALGWAELEEGEDPPDDSALLGRIKAWRKEFGVLMLVARELLPEARIDVTSLHCVVEGLAVERKHLRQRIAELETLSGDASGCGLVAVGDDRERREGREKDATEVVADDRERREGRESLSQVEPITVKPVTLRDVRAQVAAEQAEGGSQIEAIPEEGRRLLPKAGDPWKCSFSPQVWETTLRYALMGISNKQIWSKLCDLYSDQQLTVFNVAGLVTGWSDALDWLGRRPKSVQDAWFAEAHRINMERPLGATA